jgi:hypothetical protein
MFVSCPLIPYLRHFDQIKFFSRFKAKIMTLGSLDSARSSFSNAILILQKFKFLAYGHKSNKVKS